MNRAQHQLMQVIQKIPVFDGLSLEQAEKLIHISRFKKYGNGDTVYDIGGVSDEMLVLIKGKLSVLSASGQPLGEVSVGNSTGEMGVFTGHNRSATIVASEECAGLTITRNLLLDIMNADREMKSVILENVVTELSARLAEANIRLDVVSKQVALGAEEPPEEPAAVAEETAETDETEAADEGDIASGDGSDDDGDELPTADEPA
jgi:signal-transduction protein with cAMP-binding, CBS, and nucleotidyltransferase domain